MLQNSDHSYGYLHTAFALILRTYSCEVHACATHLCLDRLLAHRDILQQRQMRSILGQKLTISLVMICTSPPQSMRFYTYFQSLHNLILFGARFLSV